MILAMRIYLIIRRCARTGAFPGAFCVPNSVALASPTLWGVPFISPDSNHSSRNSTFSKQHFSPRDDQHGGKPSCPLADRQGGASAGCNFGQTAGPSLIKFGTWEGGREGRVGKGRGEGEGRGGEGEGRGGQGRGGEGRGGEGRGGEGTVHTFHKPEPLWPRSLARHPLRGWPASVSIILILAGMAVV